MQCLQGRGEQDPGEKHTLPGKRGGGVHEAQELYCVERTGSRKNPFLNLSQEQTFIYNSGKKRGSCKEEVRSQQEQCLQCLQAAGSLQEGQKRAWVLGMKPKG